MVNCHDTIYNNKGIQRCNLITLQSLVNIDTFYKDLNIAQFNKLKRQLQK